MATTATIVSNTTTSNASSDAGSTCPEQQNSELIEPETKNNKNFVINLEDEDEPLLVPKSIVKSTSNQTFNKKLDKSDSFQSNTLNKNRGIVKSESSDEKPVLHVQFHNGQPLQSSTIIPSSPSASLSSSSGSEDNSSIGNFSETRPLDGGYGWVVVCASFMVNLIADGISFSFGVLFVDFLNYFGDNKAKTAWIGSLFMGMPLLSGPIASFLTDRYGCKRVTIVGAILASTGFVISSVVDSIEVLFITFGVIAGFGLSLCYVAAVVVVAYYFDKKRSLATGLSVCGSGIGTFIFAPLTQFLINEYGWRGTMLILAGLFLNMAVCGALMRDLPFTKAIKNKKLADKKSRKRSRGKINSSSVELYSVSNSTNTGGTTSQSQPVNEENIDDGDARLFSSLVNLPTFVRNGEKVPLEALELLSTHKNVYNVLLQNYPSLLISSRSFSDSGRLHEIAQNPLSGKFVGTPSPLAAESTASTPQPSNQTDNAYLWWLKRTQGDQSAAPSRNFSTIGKSQRLPTAYLKDLRVHRHSLTYRGAMLNINRYRLRASSCPDIYRNSMTTIAKEQTGFHDGIVEFWELIVDMLDFSHFADTRYLLFAISNFLLYMWYDVIYIYLADYAIKQGVIESHASMLLSVIGIVNMFGEILLGWAGDMPWMNAGLVYAICMALCGVATAIVPLLESYTALCIASGAFGLFIAANYSLTSIILVELITIERFTNAYGLLLLVQGVANLIGPPLAGWIGDETGTYDLSFYLAGLFIALSGVILCIIPTISKYKKYRAHNRKNRSPEGSTPNGSPIKKNVNFITINETCNGNNTIETGKLITYLNKTEIICKNGGEINV